MNIPYELAVSLYKAGFTLNKATSQALNSLPVGRYEYFGGSETLGTIYEKPSLSELIEACGEEFYDLSQREKGELITNRDDMFHSEYPVGSTPEEAVAKLYIALNKP